MQKADKAFFRKLGWVLVLKLIVLWAIWFLFFRHPLPKPELQSLTSQHLLGSSTVVASPSSEIRRSHDQ